MSEVFRIKRGDSSPSIRVALRPETVNLALASVNFQMKHRRGSLVVDQAAVVESASPPVLRYDWAAGDTASAGIYEAEFRVTYADGNIETFPNVGNIAIIIGDDVR